MKNASRVLLIALLSLPAGGAWAGAGAVARVVAGGVVGLVAGTGTTLGTVVTRARLQEHYLESTGDIVAWQGAPIPLGVVAGGVAGSAGTGALAAVAGGVLGGIAGGAALGAAVGAGLSDEPEDRWAGGVMGAALGAILGFAAGWLIARRRSGRRRSTGPARGRGRAGIGTLALLAGLAVALGVPLACGGDDVAPDQLVDVPQVPTDASPAEDVLFLVGDPGKARYRHYPIIARVAGDVEAWAERIGRDSAVSVLVLGDVVYPDGMHDPGTPGFATDSARVSEQVAMVREPGALERAARMYFVAGNHDWGLHEDRTGAKRLQNLGAFLDRARERGANVDLLPPAGSGVPHVVDIGDRLRLVLLDTAWWLFDAEPNGKEAFVEGVARAIRGAGGRRVVVAAHHPFESAGPHGGFVPLFRTVGLHYLLARSGSILQDLNSRPYAEMRRALGDVFAEEGRPLAFAGGHEHSLQLIAHDTANAPRYSVVSGSASKVTGVGPIPGTVFQQSAPGYIQLVVRESGAVDFIAVAAPDRFLACPENEPHEREWERCMAEGVAAFEPVFSARLVPPDRQGRAGGPTRPDETAAPAGPDRG